MKFFASIWMKLPEDLLKKFLLLVTIFKMDFKKYGVLGLLPRHIGKQKGKETEGSFSGKY